MLLVVHVNAIDTAAAQHLRVEPAANVDLPASRQLQGRLGNFLTIAKNNFMHQPLPDKLYEKFKRIKEKILGAGNN
ncbi:unnamed protein product [Phytophthora lilii]|uniref:Unnamed protein product n=1 Tax=Phytophthora lilii TaxID=2077276 RepID=A0A9W6TZ66_9STRA|nr:unnamed protein product [Phytophthora lilii]